MHYTSVLFDLDGTLLDTLGDQSAANRDSRTEADKFSVPQCLKVCTPEIFQQ